LPCKFGELPRLWDITSIYGFFTPRGDRFTLTFLGDLLLLCFEVGLTPLLKEEFRLFPRLLLAKVLFVVDGIPVRGLSLLAAGAAKLPLLAITNLRFYRFGRTVIGALAGTTGFLRTFAELLD
tara:strand:- start:123 stop:491 length:369 start_codon:yes stop_codon:yes gene_type:complete